MDLKELQTLGWGDSINNREEKELLAKKVANKVADGQVIGFGSGTTSFLTVCAIADKIKKEKIQITAIPTSYEIKMLCAYFGIPTTSLLDKKMDWCFDGADEVDSNNWLIKGRGAAMFKDKLNIVNSKEVYILVDESKKVSKLGEKHYVPIECFPESALYVQSELKKLGAIDIKIRKAERKDGPIITESGNLIIDAKFNNIDEELEKQIKAIVGVIETGLFIGYNLNIEMI